MILEGLANASDNYKELNHKNCEWIPLDRDQCMLSLGMYSASLPQVYTPSVDPGMEGGVATWGRRSLV